MQIIKITTVLIWGPVINCSSAVPCAGPTKQVVYFIPSLGLQKDQLQTVEALWSVDEHHPQQFNLNLLQSAALDGTKS
jgi:hypothetical protein